MGKFVSKTNLTYLVGKIKTLLGGKQDKITASNKLSKDLVSGLGTASVANTGTGNGNVPVIGTDGKLPTSIIPTSAITETFVVNSQAEMLGLSSASKGDVCVRTDLKKSFILQATPYSTLSNWQELLTPADAVLSVNGQTGAVNIEIPTVGAAASKGVVTTIDSSANLPTSNAVKTFVEGKGYITSSPVTSVNGKTGAVSLSANDVGALPSTTIIPTINNGTLYFEKNGGIMGSFTNNQDYDSYVDISYPRDMLVYNEMDLNDEQKAQARLNIGAAKDTDLIITTQEEFNAFCNSLDNGTCTAERIVFVGNNAEDPMSEPTFTRTDGKGITLPLTVREVVGIKSPCIFIMNFIYNDEATGNNVAGLYSPFGNCSIKDIYLIVDGAGKCVGFHHFFNVENCMCATGVSELATDSIAFQGSTNIVNCLGVSMGANAKVYYNCSILTNCNGGGIGSQSGYCYDSCNILNGCTDEGSSTGMYNECTNILAIKEEIPKMLILTQSEYDALATKDENTLYLIKEE